MKTITLALSLICIHSIAFAQLGSNTPWIWLKGANSTYNQGNYGVLGFETGSNEPFARYDAASFTDNAGNLWMFGGGSYWYAPYLILFNDLWRYRKEMNMWTWMKGTAIDVYGGVLGVYGNYGTMGVADPSNNPGGRMGAAYWTDQQGRFWVFGGYGLAQTSYESPLNDLWMFDPATQNWTWVKGPPVIEDPGNFGTRGVPDINNNPSSRWGATTFTDNNGNLWLFGGMSVLEDCNDLWRYNIATNTWTWMKGDQTAGQPEYGSLGIPSPFNKPAVRSGAAGWFNASGDLYLFGGIWYSPQYECRNDLWKYNIASNTWTWLKGSQLTNVPSVYGSLGQADPFSTPGARTSAASFTGTDGNLWLYGGVALPAGVVNNYNDLWKYDVATNQWTWYKGGQVNQPGNYGVVAVPDIANSPGSRTRAVSWSGSAGDLWLFGGYGVDANGPGELNDLWTINSLMVIPIKLLSFTGKRIDGGTDLYWRIELSGNDRQMSIERSSGSGPFMPLATIAIQLLQQDYRYRDGYAGAPGESICYRLKWVDAAGRSHYSNVLRFTNTGSSILLYPNPVSGELHASWDNVTAHSKYAITDAAGKLVASGEVGNVQGKEFVIPVQNMASGAYQLEISNGRVSSMARFVKARE